jgi:hypothetical protein
MFWHADDRRTCSLRAGHLFPETANDLPVDTSSICKQPNPEPMPPHHILELAVSLQAILHMTWSSQARYLTTRDNYYTPRLPDVIQTNQS